MRLRLDVYACALSSIMDTGVTPACPCIDEAFSRLLACRAAVEDDLADLFGETLLAIEGSCDELCECEVLRADATSSLAGSQMGLQPELWFMFRSEDLRARILQQKTSDGGECEMLPACGI